VNDESIGWNQDFPGSDEIDILGYDFYDRSFEDGRWVTREYHWPPLSLRERFGRWTDRVFRR
jgi:hypothetical protein